MPELPDVEVYRRYLTSTSMHQRIAAIHAEDNILQDTSAQGLGRTLKGIRFTRTRRHGKRLFAGLGNDRWLMMHFGMTGYLDYARTAHDPPEHTRLLIEFSGGARLAYVSQRKLGHIRLVDGFESYLTKTSLGPDALSVRKEEFTERVHEYRGRIKSLLMRQDVIAGLGTIYSDEVLFQARIHPETALGNLTDKEIGRLHAAIHRVIERAIDAGAEPDRMPSTWLLPHRESGGRCPRCGGTIRKLRSAGRTSYVCPRCQPAPR